MSIYQSLNSTISSYLQELHSAANLPDLYSLLSSLEAFTQINIVKTNPISTAVDQPVM